MSDGPASGGPASGGPANGEAQQPLLRVVRGDPTVEELAALTVVIATRRAGPSTAQTAEPRPRSAWGSAARASRPVLRPGPDAWRMSGLPR